MVEIKTLMRQRKHERSKKSQFGQFFTPPAKAKEIVGKLNLTKDSKVLEPGCGDGSFVMALIDVFLCYYTGSMQERLQEVLTRNVYAVEFDEEVYQKLLKNVQEKYGYLPAKHNLYHADFLVKDMDADFDFSVGNPPFGATIDYKHQNELEKKYGRRNGYKIKKESYSFFVAKSIDILKPNGRFTFICGDSFLTIATMVGLRRLLIDSGQVEVSHLEYFSEETSYPMVVIDCKKGTPADFVIVDNEKVYRKDMEKTGNFSWTIDNAAIEYFSGKKLSDFMVCSSGMTTGNNAFFVKDIKDERAVEKYQYDYFDDTITLQREVDRARLNYLSDATKEKIKKQEADGEVRRNIRITELQEPVLIKLPHEDYPYYNKSSNSIIYEHPKSAIFWKDEGDAVRTFKANSNWYLHGVGGAKFFGKEGITWALIASKMKVRFLPNGYILDSGSPCGFLLPNIPQEELYFIMAWMLTEKANEILKKYINHTKNIQGKDVEKLPYPYWVGLDEKTQIIEKIKNLIHLAMADNKVFRFDSPEVVELNSLFQRK